MKITIKNFRTIEEYGFDFYQSSTIIGQRGSGKTSLLDSLSWGLFGLCTYKSVSPVFNKLPTAVSVVFTKKDVQYRIDRIINADKNEINLSGIMYDHSGLFLYINGNQEDAGKKSSIQACIDDILGCTYAEYSKYIHIQQEASKFTGLKQSDRKAYFNNLLNISPIIDKYIDRFKEDTDIKRKDIDALNSTVKDVSAVTRKAESKYVSLTATRLENNRSKRVNLQESIDTTKNKIASLKQAVIEYKDPIGFVPATRGINFNPLKHKNFKIASEFITVEVDKDSIKDFIDGIKDCMQQVNSTVIMDYDTKAEKLAKCKKELIKLNRDVEDAKSICSFCDKDLTSKDVINNLKLRVTAKEIEIEETEDWVNGYKEEKDYYDKAVKILEELNNIQKTIKKVDDEAMSKIEGVTPLSTYKDRLKTEEVKLAELEATEVIDTPISEEEIVMEQEVTQLNEKLSNLNNQIAEIENKITLNGKWTRTGLNNIKSVLYNDGMAALIQKANSFLGNFGGFAVLEEDDVSLRDRNGIIRAIETFSPGERKLLEISIAVVAFELFTQDKEWLKFFILDEPFDGRLDTSTANEVISNLLNLGYPIIVITHDVGELPIASSVRVSIDNNKTVFE